MNKALLAAAGLITGLTAFSVGMVGDTNSCGEIKGWTTPITIFVTLVVPTVLAYHAGRRKRLRDSLRAVCRKRIGVQS